MTLQDYLDILTIGGFAIIFMILGALIVTIVGPNRVARWLRLPPDDYS